jgi:hypothetical protein
MLNNIFSNNGADFTAVVCTTWKHILYVLFIEGSLNCYEIKSISIYISPSHYLKKKISRHVEFLNLRVGIPQLLCDIVIKYQKFVISVKK